MNFLLITKPEVRSVRLLGSWDNFSKQYVLERDVEVGPGYWKGCHIFTDMIGHTPDNDEWRSGGLKMGSTYWYYYLLDDNVKHYSQAEPMSRECPLLLGQAVNVLNVPIMLPDSRARGQSPSRSPQAPEHARTMSPEDRFMNPRRPPQPQPQSQAQPVLLQPSGSTRRLKSPTQIPSRTPTPGIHRSASQPHSAPRKGHTKHSRSMSPSRVRVLMAALRNPTEVDRKVQTAQTAPTAQATQLSNGVSNSSLQEEATENPRNLPGITVKAGFAIPSSQFSTKKPSPVTRPPTIQTRRVKNGHAADREPRPFLTVQTQPQPRFPSPSRSPGNDQTVASDDVRAIREALKDVANSSNLPTPTAAFAKESKEKRLPTLPNTPSSVMDEAVRAIDERDKAMNDEIPRSYFSAMTEDSTNSRIMPEQSRFSEWSTDTETDYNPHDSMVSNSTSNKPNNESANENWNTPDLSQSSGSAVPTYPNTPHLTVNSKPSSPNSASEEPWIPILQAPTVSPCTPHMTDSDLGFEDMGDVESNPKRHATLFTAIDSLGQARLSQSKDLDAALSKTQSIMTEASLERIRSTSGFEANATMQELMERLTYLQQLFECRREEGDAL